MSKRATLIASIAGVALLVIGLLYPIVRFKYSHLLFDDALMFARYARNMHSGYGPAWNPAGPATYGCTSIAFMLLTWFAFFFSQEDATVVVTLSVAGGFALFIGLGLFARWTGVREKAQVGPVLAILLLACLAYPSNLARVTWNGMDTGLAALAAALWLWALMKVEERGKGAPFVGIAGALLFWVRPELLMFSAGVPILTFLMDRSKPKWFVEYVGAFAVTLAIVMAVNQRWLGSALPLPFYGKVVKNYEEFNVARYQPIGYRLAAHYLWTSAGLLLLILAGLRSWKAWPASVRSGLIVSIGFFAFVTFGVTQIMGSVGRLYWPTMPFLFAAAAYATIELLKSRSRVPQVIGVCCVALGSLMMVRQLAPMIRSGKVQVADLTTEASFDYHRKRWPGLMAIGAIPDKLLIAATEVGHPGSLCKTCDVMDLAGLNHREIAFQPAKALELMETQKPDVIYFPPPDYVGLNRKLIESAWLQQDYIVYNPPDLRLPLPVALRKDGPHFAEIKRAVEDDLTIKRKAGSTFMRERSLYRADIPNSAAF
ncbi:MAG: hypothetical protein ACAH95_03565 [Fimbriimonas sp.]